MDPIVSKTFTVSAPGRVCLYGEHQDYLGMPSVVMAVNLRCRIKITERDDRKVVWSSPKLGDQYSGSYDLDNLLDSEIEGVQDHKLSAMILAERRGELPLRGWNAVIDSDVPVQAGCSSSSALIVAWIAGMQRLSGHITSKIDLAMQAFEAEVTYYDAPGGNMDQIACAVGGTLRVDPSAENGYVDLGELDYDWVLGDSNSPKDTMGILKRCKFDRLEILDANGGVWDSIDVSKLSEVESGLVESTIRNRDIEIEASALLKEGGAPSDKLGMLMNEHHGILRDVLKISTDKIEKMCGVSLQKGAVGAKIFGSGGGGCMLALIPRINGSSDYSLIDSVKKGIASVEGAESYHVVSEPGVSWGEGIEIENPVIILAAGASSRMKRVEGVSSETALEVVSRPKAMLRVGANNTPFLDLLIRYLKDEGSNTVVIVIGETDEVTKSYFSENPIDGVSIRYVVQTIPEGRTKPLGTSQAVALALEANTDLKSHSVTVCNGDNMPPQGAMSAIFKEESAMLAFDASNLGLPDDRVSAFAVVSLTDDGKLSEIVEKPDPSIVSDYIDDNGVLRVSMNIFKLPYLEFYRAVKNCPMSEREEKELPIAVGIWNSHEDSKMTAIPFSGEFLDLTHPSDFEFVLNKLQ